MYNCSSLQNKFYYSYFTWIDPKIKGRVKVAFEKRDEVRDLKAEVERLSEIIGRYRRESSDLKEHMSELKGETIGLLEEADILKREAFDIKNKVTKVKTECARLKREFAKCVAREKFYLIAMIVSWAI